MTGYDFNSDPFAEEPALNGKTNGHVNGNGHLGDENEGRPSAKYPWLHDLEPMEALDFTTLADNPSFSREWSVRNWVPMLETTGLGGPGGEGKTILAHMLATAAPIGHSWLGVPVEEMCAALVLCEDRPKDAHLRQADINRHYDCRMIDLAGRLLVLPRREKLHNYLGIFDQDGELHTTTFFDQLLGELKRFAAGRRLLTVLDGRSDVFRGNQNIEHQARTFVRRVPDRIAQETDGACVMLFQPSQTGKASGSGESGSVQWDAAYRCRTALEPGGDKNDRNTRRLIRKKSNFSAKDEEIAIRWDSGVFVRADLEAAKPAFEIAARYMKAERVFLMMLGRFNLANSKVSSKKSAGNFAPKEFVARGDQVEGCTVDELSHAMNSLLLDKHLIRIVKEGRFEHLVKVVESPV